MKLLHLYEQVCRQKREKENELSELQIKLKYRESCQNIASNMNSYNLNKQSNLGSNYLSNQNIYNSNSIANSSENIATHKENKDYNLTFNYNLLNNTYISNLTNNGCESKDNENSNTTKKNSHISGFKYDKGNSQSLDSIFNNSKINLNYNANSRNSNTNIKHSNFYFLNNTSENENVNENKKIDIEVTNKNEYQDMIINNNNLLNNNDKSSLNNIFLHNPSFAKNIINNITTNKNIIIYNSSKNSNSENLDNKVLIKNKIFNDQEDKENSFCLKNKQFKTSNIAEDLNVEDEINFKNSNTNKIDLKCKINTEQIAREGKINIYEDLDDVYFPDKVIMKSFPNKKTLPKLQLNFNNKSVDFCKNKNKMDSSTIKSFYGDSYKIDLDNTSLILKKSKATVRNLLIFNLFNFDL